MWCDDNKLRLPCAKTFGYKCNEENFVRATEGGTAKEGKIDRNEKHKQSSTVILYKIDIGIFYNN